MKYKDIECSICSKKFDDNSDVVVCPVCGAPYHRACWLEHGCCIHEKEHADGYRWISPVKQQTESEPEKPRDPERVMDGVFKNGEGVVICPHCETPNYENDMYCRNCHAPLKGGNKDGGRTDGSDPDRNSNGGFYSGDESESSEEYARNTEAMMNSFNLYGALDPDSLIDGIPVKEYAVYVGGNAPGKIIRKISALIRFGRTIVPSMGGLLGPIWFLRRKMYKIGAALSAVVIALFLSAGLLQITDAYRDMVHSANQLIAQSASGQISVSDMREAIADIQAEYAEAGRTPSEQAREKAAGILYSLAIYAVPLVGFMGGMSLYRADIRKKIMQIRGECSDMNTYMNELHRRGGTSAGLTLVGVLVYAAAFFLYSYLPMIIVSLS